jgi:hypothetical protein
MLVQVLVAVTQKVVLVNDIWPSLCYILAYCKNRYEESRDIRELLDLTIVVLGNLCYEHPEIQSKLRDSKILQELCDLPTNFLVDKRCV